MTKRTVSGSRLIAASPEAIFDLLSDPARHGEFDGSAMVQRMRKGPSRLQLGSRFGMDMKFGPVPYRMTSEVVEFEADRLIAWRHLGGHRWRYELEPVDGGTRVTETFDWATARSPRLIELVGYPARNQAAIEATLDRLAALIEAVPS